jgi:hypothetical protein
VTEVFGVRGDMGNLSLTPKLVSDQFDQDGNARLTTLFAGKTLKICYHNPEHLDFGEYQIQDIQIEEQPAQFSRKGNSVIIQREDITQIAGSNLALEINLVKNVSYNLKHYSNVLQISTSLTS